MYKSYYLNDPISEYAMKILSMYLNFPEDQPITAVDFRARDGKLIEKLTSKHKGPKHLYAVEKDSYFTSQMRQSEKYEKVSTSHYKSEARISKEAFSLAIIDPIISNVVQSELFDAVDTFVEPDFEKEERERLQKAESYNNIGFDFNTVDVTEEEQEKAKEDFEKKLEKSIKNRRLAFRRALREQEKKISLERSDNFLLAKATEHLMPGGVLVMITPKEMIDTAVTLRLGNQFEDIRILRLEEDEYLDKRKCIILAKKKKEKSLQDRTIGYSLAETKLTPFSQLKEIAPQAEGIYFVPTQSNDAVELFRVGPLTSGEVLEAVQKSSLLDTYKESYSQVLTDPNPVAPTPLHKGHIMLLLTSGFLNGYIGKGVNQHLVKGNAIKMTRESRETDDDGVETIKEREYYHISVKYLNNKGEFHKLM
ncbi:hypothetical protein [Virgibacillus salexigens]|uniref:Uncharacterized protein n=1 Tax=Virgibacillus massiliensis TaxID=1462526 RepID=A0A024QHB1_9BACI|nr:hypothetical protein [Virgibacillus massiliensis]CDQ41933.1 hypothetical protein BN990_04312 [Virgibacillus massiliensis]